MPTITVFRQGRIDGGVRTGIDYEGTTIMESYVDGSGDNDPALLWYVDVILSGSVLPSGSPDQVRNWLLQIESQVKAPLKAVAAELQAGIDGWIPLQRELSVPIAGLKASLAATGMRRLSGREIGARIDQFADQWREAMAAVQPLASVS